MFSVLPREVQVGMGAIVHISISTHLSVQPIPLSSPDTACSLSIHADRQHYATHALPHSPFDGLAQFCSLCFHLESLTAASHLCPASLFPCCLMQLGIPSSKSWQLMHPTCQRGCKFWVTTHITPVGRGGGRAGGCRRKMAAHIRLHMGITWKCQCEKAWGSRQG